MFYTKSDVDKIVKSNNDTWISFITEQTPETCLAAVKQDIRALQFVKNQTPELLELAKMNEENSYESYDSDSDCDYYYEDPNWKQHLDELADTISWAEHSPMEAVKKYYNALKYVKDKTPELCMEAVKRDGKSLKYVKNQTSELCMEAVKQNGYNLRFIKTQTPELCMAAVKQDGEALQFVKEQTSWEEEFYSSLCMAAVKQNGMALKYIKEQTPELCMAAVQQNKRAFCYVNPEFKNLFDKMEIPQEIPIPEFELPF